MARIQIKINDYLLTLNLLRVPLYVFDLFICLLCPHPPNIPTK